MQIERLAFIAFPVSDLVRSRRFYTDIMGATVLHTAADWIEFEMGDIGVRAYLHHGDYQRQHSGLQFLVQGIDRILAELARAGADLRSDVRTELWGGRVLTVADPDGNLFDLLDATYAATIN
jgi:catechol 2,3-dioxygenase-like lactoylglutathione lyase family enzyme